MLQQFRMTGRIMRAEVINRTRESVTEELSPHPIHHGLRDLMLTVRRQQTHQFGSAGTAVVRVH